MYWGELLRLQTYALTCMYGMPSLRVQHFWRDCQDGLELGIKVGQLAVQRI